MKPWSEAFWLPDRASGHGLVTVVMSSELVGPSRGVFVVAWQDVRVDLQRDADVGVPDAL